MADFYLDFTASGGGTGTFASPWNRYASITGTTTADTVWVRRVSYTETVAAAGIGTGIPDNTPVVGWPLIGDTRYVGRPAAAQATWDPDAGLYAEVLHIPTSIGDTSNLSLATLGLAPNAGKTFKLSRLKFYRYGRDAGLSYDGQCIFGFKNEGTSQTATLNFIFERCWFEYANGGNVTTSANGGPGAVGYFGSRSGGTASHTVTDVGSTFIARYGTRPWAHIFEVGWAGSQTVFFTMTNSVMQIENPSSDTTEGSGWLDVAYAGGTSQSNISGIFDACTFEWLSVNRSSDLFYYRTGNPQGMLFHRCTFKTPPGSPVGMNRLRTRNYRYTDCNFIGMASIDVNDSGCSLSAYAMQVGPDTGVAAIGMSTAPNFVRLANVSFAPGSARDISFFSSTEGRGGGRFSLRTLSDSSAGIASATNGVVATADPFGSPGYRKTVLPTGIVQVVSASRVGGARYSFVLAPTSTAYAAAAGLSTTEPGFDTVFISLKPGANTVTVFGAHLGYAIAPTTTDVWVEVEVPSGAGNTVTAGLRNGVALAADTSTWNGISGTITRFTLALSVTVTVPAVAILRGYASKSGGFVYIDPNAVLS